MSDSVLYIGDRKTSAHRDTTLMARFELAKDFVSNFPVDGEPFTTEAFDAWGVERNRVDAISGEADIKSAEWAKRLQQRHELKKEINLGGKCDLFAREDQFQLVVNEHGKSMRVIPLFDRARDITSSMPDDLFRTLERERREVERMINAIGIHRMTESERSMAVSCIESVDDFAAVTKTLSERHIVKLSRLRKSLLTQVQGVLPQLIANETGK